MNVVGNRTLVSVLEAHARRSDDGGDRPFLIYVPAEGPVREVSYRAVQDQTLRLEAQLAWDGVRPGDRIHMQLGNCPEAVLLLLACAHLGATLVPTSPESTEDETSYVVEHSGACRSFRDSREIREMPACDRPYRPRLDLTYPLEILYTSGTTSRPKGVVITHSAAVYAAECMARATALRSDDRHLVSLPLHHAAAQFHALLPTLVVGGTVIMTERFSASRWFDLALEYRATAAALFATPLRMILAQPFGKTRAQSDLRFVTYAQNLTREQWDRWHESYGVPLVQLWGMTETVGLPLINPLGFSKPMSMGRPALGYECAILDATGRVAPLYDEEQEQDPREEIGDLVVYVRPGVDAMLEYYRNPEATAETLQPLENAAACGPTHVLRTGDRAYADTNGYFYFVDRAKDMIKRSGENIAPAEVESVLKAHPHVVDAAVVGIPDPLRDQAVKAFVIVQEGAGLDAGQIRDWCRQKLSAFKVPEFVEFKSEFPRTSVGKVQKHRLRGPDSPCSSPTF